MLKLTIFLTADSVTGLVIGVFASLAVAGLAEATEMFSAAKKEERLRRVKHWAGFPSQTIAYCLREAGVRLSDVAHVAVNQDSRTNLDRTFAYLVSQQSGLGLIADRLRHRRARQSIPELLATNLPGGV